MNATLRYAASANLTAMYVCNGPQLSQNITDAFPLAAASDLQNPLYLLHCVIITWNANLRWMLTRLLFSELKGVIVKLWVLFHSMFNSDSRNYMYVYNPARLLSPEASFNWK